MLRPQVIQGEKGVRVSVIIPTYNRAELLGITVESFVSQDFPDDQYEIIIADNNSNDNTKDVVAQWQARSPVAIKYIFVKKQGVHYARNAAAGVSKGEILYYTDDDMVADSSLLKNLLKVFAMGYNVASATGRVLPKWEVPPPKWILKYFANSTLSLNDSSQDLVIAPYDVEVFSCHQAILREVFFRSGGFNPENTAGEWIGDGETGLNIKIKELGYKFAYVGDSVIYHMIPPQRMTQKYINKRLANQGNCDSYTDYRRHMYSSAKLYGKIFQHVKNMLLYAACTALKVAFLRGSWRVNRAYMSYCINRIKYDYRLIHDKWWREMVLRRNWIDDSWE
jgi:glycosyltransferase involved in cell wall biosynthesis